MMRCAILAWAAAVCFAADPAQDAAAVITELASSLTAGNAQQFLAAFDPAMPGYEKLRADIQALVRVGETQSYVEVAKNEGDERTRTLALTWELRIQREGDATATRREAKLTCSLERQGKRWRVVRMEPVEFFGP